MRRLQLAFAVAVALWCVRVPLAAEAGEIIERIVVTVNNRPILQSDLDDEVRLEAFLDARPLGSISDADRSAALGRLIDRALIDQQADEVNLRRATDQEVAQQVRQVRSQHPAGARDDTWQQALRSYGLEESDLAARVRSQLDELRFIDQRFRPAVRISLGEVQRYYRDQFLPELQKAGAEPRPLKEVQPQIEEVLTQERLTNMLSNWLQTLRGQASINYRGVPPPPAASAQSAPPLSRADGAH
ncbi:MAG TPA: SurA N-terminal domain-containing protein [Terriglobales bacterium]|nr:SurA N-terminal domain-containing protein [Terriglobales bacterium]